MNVTCMNIVLWIEKKNSPRSVKRNIGSRNKSKTLHTTKKNVLKNLNFYILLISYVMNEKIDVAFNKSL